MEAVPDSSCRSTDWKPTFTGLRSMSASPDTRAWWSVTLQPGGMGGRPASSSYAMAPADGEVELSEETCRKLSTAVCTICGEQDG